MFELKEKKKNPCLILNQKQARWDFKMQPDAQEWANQWSETIARTFMTCVLIS